VIDVTATARGAAEASIKWRSPSSMVALQAGVRFQPDAGSCVSNDIRSLCCVRSSRLYFTGTLIVQQLLGDESH
jgi:hypothetical protein